MSTAAALSQALHYSRERHVIGLPWTKLATYAAWVGCLLVPAALMFAHGLQMARRDGGLGPGRGPGKGHPSRP
jgi:hypothetical protein